ncbi:hypothetical protein N789_11755 [Arenimonas oryziterrae DSM 21050 = YC6267]|uniref:Uncharacterized protein n=1 Tax=Arenimonas oryziterrae DSM 21050 = YC6267 TaxID=1121015 RepID=A0A091ARH6_9GAMM|nr:hypothetical protein N789_11755 [Arenimonas oryziterrae DSM 21050 = YC6267]
MALGVQADGSQVVFADALRDQVAVEHASLLVIAGDLLVGGMRTY